MTDTSLYLLAGTFFFIFGLCIGSFLNVVIYRLPKGKSLVSPGSACPSCNKPIEPYDNIPLLSYLLLGGKCRNCKRRISPRYFLVELLTGALFLLLFVKFGLSPALGPYILFTACLIAVSFIDIDTMYIPVIIVYPAIGLGILLSAVVPGMYTDPALMVPMKVLPAFLNSFIGAALGAGLILGIGIAGKAVFKKEAMGEGDIPLMAMIGAFLGWRGVFMTLFFASLAGTVISLLIIMVAKSRKIDDPVPFGPYLSLGALICVFCKGLELMQYYFIP